MTDLHPVPTPRDLRPVSQRDDVVAVGRAVAEACGLDGDVYEAELRNVPALDLPKRTDRRRVDTAQPEPFTARVFLSAEPSAQPVTVNEVTSWREHDGRLDLYGTIAGERQRVQSFAPYSWVRVQRTSEVVA